MARIIIIGGGPAGYSAAIRASQLNFDVVLVEKKALGGTCLNVGCIPTKALLYASELFAQASSSEFIVGASNLQADLDKIYQRSNGIVQKFNYGVQALIKGNNIKYYNTGATLLSKSLVKLDSGEILEGDKIVLATGAMPFALPIDGIQFSITSDEVVQGRFGKHDNVTIIGGGVIGMEFASFFSNLGSKVTVIDMVDKVLNNMSNDISKYVTLSMRKKKVKLALSAKVTALLKLENGVKVEYTDRRGVQSVVSDMVISCVGRVANNIVGVENTNILFDNGFIVDKNGRTAEENIYAVGDCVKGNIQLAHYASADGIRVIEHINGDSVSALTNVPSCVYTSPNAGVVGRKEEDCDFEIEVGRFNMGANGKSLTEGVNLGFIKVIFDKESQRLIGAEMVCNSACELVGFVSNMINKGFTRKDILSTVYPHPSIAEAFFEAVEDSRKSSIHTIYKGGN